MKSPHIYSTPSSSRLSANGEENDGSSVFVGFVPIGMNEFRLASIFSRSIGPVRDVSILRDRNTGQSRECAFVRFDSEHFAKKATEIRWFCDPITRQRMVVKSYDAKLAGKGNLKTNAKKTNEVRQSLPSFVQVDDISSTVEMPSEAEKVPEKPVRRNWLDDKGKEIAIRKHLEEIENRTHAENKAIFVGRFMQTLNEWHIRKEFSNYGTINFVKMFQKSFRVEFAHKRMAAIAIRSMNGKEWGETGKIFICDWWSWSADEQKVKKRSPLRTKALSKSPIRRKQEEKRVESEPKRSKPSEEKAPFLPLTKKSLPPPPSPFEYLSTSESENEIENGQSEEAKLAQEFSEKNLPTSERMKAILKLIRPKAEEL